MWFEGVIRDHLDAGRPHQVAILFDRRISRRTKGTFGTLTLGADPILSCYCKSSRLKQSFKEGRALRTETVICDTRDFGIGRLVCEGKLVYIVVPEVLAGKRRGQTQEPAPEEAPHRTRAQPVAFCSASGSSQLRNPLSKAS